MKNKMKCLIVFNWYEYMYVNTTYEECGINVIYSRKMTSYKQERVFGRRRQMSETNYWTGVKNFF